MSLLALSEILRDYFQILEIIFSKIGEDLHNLMKFSFVGFGFILSLGFGELFNMSGATTFWLLFILQIGCVAYLARLAFKESKKRHQGIDGELWVDASKSSMYIARAIIFLTTTIFYSICSLCMHILTGHSKYKADFAGSEGLYGFLSVLLLILTLVAVQFYFIKAIRFSSPAVSLYDPSGKFLVDSRVSYQNELKRISSPFKAMYGEYSHGFGKYYKVIMMLKKYVLLTIFIIELDPKSEQGPYIAQYVLFWIIEFGFIYFQKKKQPYHAPEHNWMTIGYTIANIICCIFNLIVVISTDKGSDGRLAMVIVQFIVNTAYSAYLLKMIIFASKHAKNCVKRLFRFLEFSSISTRGKLANYPKKEKYKNYLMFNEEAYNAETEIQLQIWHAWWDNELFILEKYKSPVPVEKLGFIKFEESPPYLKKLTGKLQERQEENIRIAQQISLQGYRDSLQQLNDPNFFKINTNFYQFINGVDAYCIHPKSNSNFGKCSLFPFPFTAVFAFDDCDDILFVKEQEKFQEIMNLNFSQEVIDKKQIRLTLRALNGRGVYYYQRVRETRRKTRKNSEGKTEYYTVQAWVTYEHAVVHNTPKVSTKYQVKSLNDVNIDVGPGFKISLKYSSGKGIDDENEHYTNNGRTFDSSCIGLTSAFVMTEQMKTLFEHPENQPVIQQNFPVVKQQFDGYRIDQQRDVQRHVQTMSYAFYVNIYNAEIEQFYDQQKVYDLLQNEQNEELKYLFQNESELIETLYKRLEFVKKSPTQAFKYFFFLDVWEKNQNVKQIKEAENIINPKNCGTECLAFRDKLEKEELKSILLEHKLRSKSGGGYFKDEIIDQYYEMIQKLEDPKHQFRKSFTGMELSKIKSLPAAPVLAQSQIQTQEQLVVQQPPPVEQQQQPQVQQQQVQPDLEIVPQPPGEINASETQELKKSQHQEQFSAQPVQQQQQEQSIPIPQQQQPIQQQQQPQQPQLQQSQFQQQQAYNQNPQQNVAMLQQQANQLTQNVMALNQQKQIAQQQGQQPNPMIDQQIYQYQVQYQNIQAQINGMQQQQQPMQQQQQQIDIPQPPQQSNEQNV